ncbi:MAG: tetratricopeptide repeat protein [Lentisphaeria bacterium]|nr:tetratricopeptide repeat protein [Lentisphaeria bacterium]
MRIYAVLSLLLLSAVLFPLTSAASPWEDWRSGYTNCDKAERQLERGNYTEALTLFEKARKSYLSVRSARPDWNQQVIAERIADCDRRINEVRRLLGGVRQRKNTPPQQTAGTGNPSAKKPSASGNTTPPASAASSGSSTSSGSGDDTVDIGEYLELRAELSRVKEDLGKLSKTLIETKAALIEARREAASLRKNSQTQRRFETEIANLLRDRRIAMEKHNLLLERYRKLETELAKPDARIAELQKSLVDARVQLEKERLRGDDALKKLREAEELARNNHLARSAAEKLMIRARTEREAALREIEALRKQISDFESQIKDLSSQVAALSKHNAELAANAGKNDSSSGNSSEANAEILRLRAELAARDRRITELEDTNRRQKLALNNAERRNREAVEQLAAMKTEFERGSAALKKSMDEAVVLRRRNGELEADIKQLSGKVSALTKRLETRDSEDFRNASAARETCRKLEKDLLTLQNELVEIRNSSSVAATRIADLQRQLKATEGELKKLRSSESALIAEKDQLSSEVKRLRDVESKLVSLQHNFDALNKENSENRALIAAAKPRERELANVKLRLLEMERLKSSLVREQQLNEELRSECRRLGTEVKTLRSRSAELDRLRRQFAELAGVQKELEQLKKLRAEYTRISGIEKLYADLKIRSGELESLLRERDARITRLTQEFNASGKTLSDVKKQLAALQGVQKRNLELDAMISSQNQEISRLNAMVKELRAGKGDVMAIEHRNQIASLRKTIEKLSPVADRFARLQQEFENAKQQFSARISRLTSRCTAANEVVRLREEEIKRLQKLNAELAAMKRDSGNSLQNRVDQAQLSRLNSELSAMRELYTAVTAERDRLITELDNLRRGITPETQDVPVTESAEELAATGLRAERDGNLELAIWNYKQALTAAPDFSSAHLRLGALLFSRKDYSGALPHLSAARIAAPDNVELAVKTARCQILLKRFGNAKSIVDAMMKKHSGDYRVQMLAGLVEAASGSQTAAEERLVTSCRLAPDKTEPLIELARLLCDSVSDRKGEAVKTYEKARALGASPVPDLEKKLGSLLDNRRDMIRFFVSAAAEAEISGDFGSAVWYYRKLVEIKPEDFVPRLALALHRNSNTAQARETLEFNTPSRFGMMVLAIIENESGNHAAALRAARQCSGVKLPADWQAMTMEIGKLRNEKRPSAAMRMLLSGIVTK